MHSKGRKVMKSKSLSQLLPFSFTTGSHCVTQRTAPASCTSSSTSAAPSSAGFGGSGWCWHPKFTGRLCVWQGLILRIVQRCCQPDRRCTEALLLAWVRNLLTLPATLGERVGAQPQKTSHRPASLTGTQCCLGCSSSTGFGGDGWGSDLFLLPHPEQPGYLSRRCTMLRSV